jgi:hypothetical protein
MPKIGRLQHSKYFHVEMSITKILDFAKHKYIEKQENDVR